MQDEKILVELNQRQHHTLMALLDAGLKKKAADNADMAQMVIDAASIYIQIDKAITTVSEKPPLKEVK